MAEIVDEILSLSGLAPDVFPSTLAELLPWLVKITVGTVALSGVFRFLGKLVEVLFIWRRW